MKPCFAALAFVLLALCSSASNADPIQDKITAFERSIGQAEFEEFPVMTTPDPYMTGVGAAAVGLMQLSASILAKASWSGWQHHSTPEIRQIIHRAAALDRKLGVKGAIDFSQE